MKTRLLIAGCLAAAVAAPQIAAAAPVKLYPFEKATLTYTISGGQTGTQTVYIKDYGRSMVQHYEATMPAGDGEQKIDVATFTDPQWVYTYDYVTGEATKAPNRQAEVAETAGSGKAFFEQMTRANGGVQSGTDTYNGTPCTVWKMGDSGTTLCVDDNMVMQYMRSDGDMVQGNVELQKVDVGRVDDSKFQRPSADYQTVDPFGDGPPPQ
ncbi:MAG: hypothetical protein GC201_12230 [Alphaproteobacteria bacterium]|nr:hypothetical protein [Alphaproteobacteria bacterium]